MSKWVIASTNQGKLKEFQRLLAGVVDTLVPLQDLTPEQAEEPALTFVENALLKARHAARYCEGPVLADDSGLVIPALQGEPGVRSARYTGQHNDFERHMAHVLSELARRAPKHRQAYFTCVLVLLNSEHDPCPIVAEGRWYGEITEAPEGDGGFGYDPIFWDPLSQQTAASMSQEAKNERSHRGLAVRQLCQHPYFLFK